MSLHADARAVLRAWAAPDPEQGATQQAYLDLLDRDAAAVWREGVPDHLTASCVVLDPTGERTLLTLHAKAQQWFQLGGHCEPDDPTLAAAALREASEESQIPADGLAIDPIPVQLSVHPVPFCRPPGLADSAVVRHFDVRFLVIAADPEAARASAESLDVRWWPIEELPNPDADLLDAVQRARRRLEF